MQDGRRRPLPPRQLHSRPSAYIVDEPPGLLGDDTAPNPSEASLAALGSCIAVGLHANAVHRGITVNSLEVELEGDLNITAVWGTGDVSEKPVGFTDVRIIVHMDADAPQETIDELIAHVCQWSPVFNTFSRPVNMVAEFRLIETGRAFLRAGAAHVPTDCPGDPR